MQGAPQVVVSRLGAAARRRLEDDGYEVELWSLGAGGGLVGLALSAEGLLHVDQGTARVEAGGQEVTLAAGDQVLLPAGASFGIHAVAGERLVWLTATRTPAADAPGRERRGVRGRHDRRLRGLRLFPGPR